MRFIEIMDGLSVNLAFVSLISRVSDAQTQLHVDGETYLTDIPYDTLKKLLISWQVKEALDPLEQLARFQVRPTP